MIQIIKYKIQRVSCSNHLRPKAPTHVFAKMTTIRMVATSLRLLDVPYTIPRILKTVSVLRTLFCQGHSFETLAARRNILAIIAADELFLLLIQSGGAPVILEYIVLFHAARHAVGNAFIFFLFFCFFDKTVYVRARRHDT